ncbi:MAG: Sec-independent protein translocase protein TatB [Flavobacteriaceae bacterium]
MLDVGWSEMLVVAVILIVVVGPRDLPGVLRTFGRYMGQVRRMAGDFQRQFNDALREAELDDVKRDIESVSRDNPVKQLGKSVSEAMEPLRDAGKSVAGEAQKQVDQAAAASKPAASEPKVAAQAKPKASSKAPSKAKSKSGPEAKSGDAA